MNIKILQTPIRFYPYIGGVENHVYYLSKELVKIGNSVNVICAEEPKSDIKMVEGINVKRLKYLFKITNTNICFSFPYQLLKSNYDIVHTHMPTPWTSDWSVVLAKIMGKKSILTIHNDMDKASLISKIVTKIYLNTLFKITLSLTDRIIIVNPDWKQSFKSTKNLLVNHKEKISVIPNGVDLSFFSNKNGKKQKNTILFVSILDEHHSFKGLDYLLESLVEVRKRLPNINLLIVGEGKLKKYYQLKAKKLGIINNVTFIGAINQKKLASYYNKASLFILPSTEIEGFGIVLLEAMACKLPVVTTKIAGVWKDVNKYNTGLIVKPRDPFSLAQATITILQDKKLAKAMGNNGKRLIQKKYDWKLVAKQVEKLYMEVLQ